ncbi:MAG: hypothetical protein JNJ73_01570 [Hyphomonadaceae bacterium]|nr:hypothetical protein [Hyphomonadaceae bacterium]
MPDSLRFWPPPPETPEIRKEQVKLSATALNAISVTAVIAALIGPFVTTIPDSDLTPWVRAGLLLFGVAMHLAGRLLLRYINE